MVEVDLQILKSDILGALSEESAYKSSHAQDNKFDRQYIKTQDWTYIENHWNSAKQNIIDCVKKFITNVSDNSDNDFNVTLSIPNFDANLEGSLSSAIKRYFIDYMMRQWLIINEDDSAKDYDALCTTDLQNVKKFLYSRLKPVYK
jgi:hypothetical protein